MRKIKEVLRLKLDAKLSHEQIAAALTLSKGVVTKYVGRAAAAGLDWPAVQLLDDVALERRLLSGPEKPRLYVQPDFGRIHQELRRKGVTLMLLWEEYRAEYAEQQTYGYSQFYEKLQRFCGDITRLKSCLMRRLMDTEICPSLVPPCLRVSARTLLRQSRCLTRGLQPPTFQPSIERHHFRP